MAFYAEKNPRAIKTVDARLQDYAGNEEELFHMLVAKYGPTALETGPASTLRAAPAPKDESQNEVKSENFGQSDTSTVAEVDEDVSAEAGEAVSAPPKLREDGAPQSEIKSESFGNSDASNAAKLDAPTQLERPEDDGSQSHNEPSPIDQPVAASFGSTLLGMFSTSVQAPAKPIRVVKRSSIFEDLKLGNTSLFSVFGGTSDVESGESELSHSVLQRPTIR